MPVLRTKTSRMWLPDALRGLALLNMLAYHAMYDWVYVFGHESSWYNIWAPGCHASSVCHRAQYAAGLHAASARNLRCTVGVAHGAGVKGPKYEQYKNFHFSENCC